MKQRSDLTYYKSFGLSKVVESIDFSGFESLMFSKKTWLLVDIGDQDDEKK